MANPRRLSSPRTRGSRSRLAEYDNGEWIPASTGMTEKAELIRHSHAIALTFWTIAGNVKLRDHILNIKYLRCDPSSFRQDPNREDMRTHPP